jgi:ketosteroid isomerase-like protein
MRSTDNRQCQVALFSIASCLFVLMTNRTVLAAESIPPHCGDPAYRQFDFWKGEWDVFNADSTSKVAHARIDSILDGCVLREDFQDTSGQEGQSFTIYDSSRKLWHQTWVTSHGVLLEIEGRFEDGEMSLSGKNQGGEIVRGTWKPENGLVREIAQKSADGGKNWDPWFDITFRPAFEAASKPTDTAADDATDIKKVVGALDAEYQEAVKQNDAATMERILSDSFVLVTSSGRSYTKSELLEEAKAGHTHYEHQEDTDKTVRLWGDTAVVTAKLWEKGTEDGKPFEYKLWFSDIYRRTPTGWRYVFAQSAFRAGESVP